MCCPSILVNKKVGACLGEIGVINSDAVSFSQEIIDYKKHKTTQASEEAIKASKEAPFYAAKIGIIELLNEYLTNESVDVIRLSSECLSAIFSSPSGAKIYDYLSPRLREYLKPFNLRKKPAKASIVEPDDDTESETLWDPRGQAYTSWLTKLTSHLATSFVSQEFFRLTAKACMVIPEFAEFAFPFFLEDILENTKREVDISHFIDNNLLSERNNNIEAKKLILNTLNYLRARKITAVQHKWKEEILRAAAKKGKPTPISFHIWDNPLWADLDFIKIVNVSSSFVQIITPLVRFRKLGLFQRSAVLGALV